MMVYELYDRLLFYQRIGTHYSPVHLQLHQEVEHAHVMQTVHKLSLLCYITDCLFHETVVHCHQN